MKKVIILLLVVLFLYFGCTSVEHTSTEETQKRIIEQIEDEPSFIEKAEALLTLPSDDRFISLIAQHHDTHREDVFKLLDL